MDGRKKCWANNFFFYRGGWCDIYMITVRTRPAIISAVVLFVGKFDMIMIS